MSPKFHFVLLCGQPFWVTGYFEDKGTESPQNELEQSKVHPPYMCYWCTRIPNFTQFCCTASCFRDCRKFEVHRITLDWSKTLNGVCIYKVLTPEAQILARFAQRPAFSRNKVVETSKRTEWLQTDLEHLTVKSTLYLRAYPRGPKFGPFRSTSSHFQDNAHVIIPHWLA